MYSICFVQTLSFEDFDSGKDLNALFELSKESQDELVSYLSENSSENEGVFHARLLFEKDEEAVKNKGNKGDGKDYSLSFVLEAQQNEQESKTFMWITIFTVSFGLLLIVFLKKLKVLTHGAEDVTGAE